MRTYAIGLDPSLSSFGIAAVTVEDGAVRHRYSTVIRPPKPDKDEGLAGRIRRLIWIERDLKRRLWGPGLPEMLEEWTPGEPICAVVEGYSYGSPNQAHFIGELGWLVRRTLLDSKIPFTEMQPKALKKFVTGNGNAAKDIVRLEAYKRFEIEAVTNDEVEANCLALAMVIGMGWVEPDLPAKNLQGLGKVRWPQISTS